MDKKIADLTVEEFVNCVLEDLHGRLGELVMGGLFRDMATMLLDGQAVVGELRRAGRPKGTVVKTTTNIARIGDGKYLVGLEGKVPG